jgi:hypothetical protein
MRPVADDRERALIIGDAALRRRQAEFEGGGARASVPIAPKWAAFRHGSASEGQSSASHGRYQSANRTRRASGQFAFAAAISGKSTTPPKIENAMSQFASVNRRANFHTIA